MEPLVPDDEYPDVVLGDWRVIVSPAAMQQMSPFRQRKRRAPEAGGILLGEVDERVLLITQASLPTALDRCSRCGFVRHRASAQDAITQAYEESDGRRVYLGEWHTHPATVARPSRQDLRMIRKQWRRNDIPASVLVLLILGLGVDFLSLWDGRTLHRSG